MDLQKKKLTVKMNLFRGSEGEKRRSGMIRHRRHIRQQEYIWGDRKQIIRYVVILQLFARVHVVISRQSGTLAGLAVGSDVQDFSAGNMLFWNVIVFEGLLD